MAGVLVWVVFKVPPLFMCIININIMLLTFFGFYCDAVQRELRGMWVNIVSTQNVCLSL